MIVCYRNYTVIYYHRHQSNTLRYYTLEIPKHNVPNRGTVGSAYLASAIHDFTAPKRDKFHTGINDVVLYQVGTFSLLLVWLR